MSQKSKIWLKKDTKPTQLIHFSAALASKLIREWIGFGTRHIQDLNSGYEVDLLLFQSLPSCHIHLKPEAGPLFMQQWPFLLIAVMTFSSEDAWIWNYKDHVFNWVLKCFRLSLSDYLLRLQTLKVAHCSEVSLMIGAGPKQCHSHRRCFSRPIQFKGDRLENPSMSMKFSDEMP